MTITNLEQRVARREAVLDRIRAILTGAMNLQRAPETIDPDTPLFGTGLRLDSLDAVDLWVHVSMEFKLQAPEGQLERMRSMRTLNTLADQVLANSPVVPCE